MAALHLAMAVDCLRSAMEVDGGLCHDARSSNNGPKLRIVASSG